MPSSSMQTDKITEVALVTVKVKGEYGRHFIVTVFAVLRIEFNIRGSQTPKDTKPRS